MKPIEHQQLVRKLAGFLGSQYPARVASRVGERMHIVELSKVSHFFAEDKLTYAAAGAKNFTVDHTISELEQKLDPRQFYRITARSWCTCPGCGKWIREWADPCWSA